MEPYPSLNLSIWKRGAGLKARNKVALAEPRVGLNSNDRRTLPLLKVRILEMAYDIPYLIETTPLLLTTLLRTLDILSFSQVP